MNAPMVTADRRLTALILKVVRALGRLGIPVYAITEDRLTPAAVSRYCIGRFMWRATGLKDPAFLAAARGRAAIGPRSRG